MTKEQGFNTYSTLSSTTEIDMSTAKIYTLTMEGPDTMRVNEYDIATGNTILLGVVSEPGFQGIISEATGFDSDHGILYYVGFSGNSQRLLYAMNVRDQIFNYTTIPLTTLSSYISLTCINYDNLNDKLYGLMTTYDSTWAFSANSVAEIDYITGNVSELGELTGITGYVGGSSCFDQLSGSFLLVGIDTSSSIQMIVFNTYNNSFVTGYIPDGVSEIVCDNYNYARSVYTSVDGDIALQGKLKVFPVPAADQLTVELPFQGEMRIIDSYGRIVFSQHAGDLRQVISLAGIPAGLYIIENQNAEQVSRARFVKL
ncbi:MAG: T9SS type A sorting domain-containing protein [Bacteroidales bacterium]